MRIFDLLEVFADDTDVANWPGGQFVEMDDADNYAERAKTRLLRLKAYLIPYGYIYKRLRIMYGRSISTLGICTNTRDA